MFTFFYSLFDLRSFLSSPNTLFSASVRYGRKIRAKSFRRIPLAFVGGMICPKKVWLGFILLAILVRFPTLAFRVPCLLRSSRQCRSHCYCLLDWNAHAHQTLNACRAIAPLGHRTQIVHSPWPPFLLSPLSSRRFGVPASFPKHLHASLLCTIPAPRGGISDFFCCWLVDVIPLLSIVGWIYVADDGSRFMFCFFAPLPFPFAFPRKSKARA